MFYKDPFVLYLNISVCIILLFLALPSLLNRKESLKIRLAFSLIFFTVIVNCTTNVFILLLANHRFIPVVFMAFFIPLLFGPAVFYYVKNLMGSSVGKRIYLTILPGIACFCYGLFLIVSDDRVRQNVLEEIIAGDNTLFNTTNFLTLFFIMLYCIKSWLFLNKITPRQNEEFSSQSKHKKAWAKEFILYIFLPVLIFSILHVMVLARLTVITTMDMDLIWMPVFMLVVYLLIAVRSMMMYKEFEHQYNLAKIESDKQIQYQRLEIARDLHDSLGAQLTLIALVTDGIKDKVADQNEQLKLKADTLADFTENAISELKNALWILNTDEIRLDDLRDKLLNFITRAREAKEGVDFQFQFDIANNLTVPSKLAVNLIRIVQEIVNNAIKYSRAKNVWIYFNQCESKLTLKITDNGVGFDATKKVSDSFGFTNMRQRIHEMNGRIEANSSKDQGTAYLIEISLVESNSRRV